MNKFARGAFGSIAIPYLKRRHILFIWFNQRKNSIMYSGNCNRYGCFILRPPYFDCYISYLARMGFGIYITRRNR